VPVIPLFALGLAVRVARGRGLARWTPGLLAIGLGLLVFMSLEPAETRMVNGRDEPTRVWTALQGTRPVDAFLPHLARRAGPDWLAASLLASFLCGLLVLDALALRSDRVDALFRGLALPVGLVVVGASLLEALRLFGGSGP
jgi:hypothetical protein